MSSTPYPMAEAATQRAGHPMVAKHQLATLMMATGCLVSATSFAVENHPLRPVAAYMDNGVSRYAHSDRAGRLREALQAAYDEATEWSNAGDMDLPDVHTWSFAASSLLRLTFGLGLDAPLLTPLQGGGLGAEWHGSGLNIELRYRGPYDTYVLIEDATGQLESRASRTVPPDAVRAALEELTNRAS